MSKICIEMIIKLFYNDNRIYMELEYENICAELL